MIKSYLALFFILFSRIVFCQLELPNNTYNSFFYKDNNSLWLSSGENSWCRYDGKSNFCYESGDSISGLKGSWIQSDFVKDSNNILWTSTEEYICNYNSTKNEFKCFQPLVEGAQVNSDIKIIGYDPKNNILLYRGGNYIYQYNLSFDIHSKISKDSTYGVRFFIDPDNNTIDKFLAAPWITNHTLEIWTKASVDWEKVIVDFSKCQGKLNQILVSQAYETSHHIWLLTNIGLVKLDYNSPCESEVYNPEGKKLDSNCFVHFDNQFYITTKTNGLYVFDLQDKLFLKNYNDSSEDIPLFSNSPKEIFSDNKSLYVSHRNIGLQCIPFKSFKNRIEYSEELPGSIDRIIESVDRLIVGVNGEGISIISNKNIVENFIPFRRDFKIKDIMKSKTGFYYCDYYNLYEYDFYTKRNKQLKNDRSHQIHMLSRYDDSLAMVANANFFVYNESFNSFEKRDFSSQLYHYNQFDSNHSLIATGTSLVEILDNNEKISIDIGQYVNCSAYSSYYKNYYVGTSNGAFYLDVGTKKCKQIDHWKLNEEKITDLIVDSADLYITTESGFYVLEDNEQVLRLDVGAEKFDGKRNMIIYGNDIVWNENGTLYAIDKEKARHKNENQISIENSSYAINQEANLFSTTYRWKDRPPSFHFTYSNYLHNENGLFRYKIDGVNSDYVTKDIADSLSIPNLSQGNYTVSVIGVNQDMTESNRINIGLIVKGPFYTQWWFFILLPLVIFGLVYWYFRTKTNRLLKLHYMREEINSLEKSALQAQMNPHFIFNCLNAIQNFISQNEKESAMDYLGMFARLIRQYLNASVSERISLEEEISMLNTYCELESLRFSNRFDYVISYAKDIDPLAIKIPSMLIQPFVENAILHGIKSSIDGSIKVHFTIDGAVLKVTVQDNGMGFDPNTINIKKSLGMSITQKRLRFIKESAGEDYNITIDSSTQGTSILVKIPF